jgi:hypothetical protein
MYWDGKRGERIFKERMEYKGYSVKDERDNPECWQIDVDFTITSPFTGAVKKFEVKWDSKIHTTGNLYLETENIFSKQWNREGWYLHCEADYLAYGDSQTSTFYIIPMKELRERVEELPHRVAHCANESTGLLVSLKDIEDLYQIV